MLLVAADSRTSGLDQHTGQAFELSYKTDMA